MPEKKDTAGTKQTAEKKPATKTTRAAEETGTDVKTVKQKKPAATDKTAAGEKTVKKAAGVKEIKKDAAGKPAAKTIKKSATDAGEIKTPAPGKKPAAADAVSTKYSAELAQSKKLADAIAKTLLSKKALDVIAIKVDHLTTVADYFIIAGAKSTTAVRALGEAVDEMTSKEMDIEVKRREGFSEARWIAMDYGSIILHIFLNEAREFYQLERLWTDGLNIINYND